MPTWQVRFRFLAGLGANEPPRLKRETIESWIVSKCGEKGNEWYDDMHHGMLSRSSDVSFLTSALCKPSSREQFRKKRSAAVESENKMVAKRLKAN